LELDDTICYCFHVSKRKILQYLRVRNPRRASQLTECGGAGTGCGWCRPFLERYFQQACESGALAQDDLTPEQYARRRAAYIRAGKGTPAPGAIPLPDEDEPGTSGREEDRPPD
jgi:NAD(P)H-nitrite reductase large subunit